MCIICSPRQCHWWWAYKLALASQLVTAIGIRFCHPSSFPCRRPYLHPVSLNAALSLPSVPACRRRRIAVCGAANAAGAAAAPAHRVHEQLLLVAAGAGESAPAIRRHAHRPLAGVPVARASRADLLPSRRHKDALYLVSLSSVAHVLQSNTPVQRKPLRMDVRRQQATGAW